MIHNPEVGSSSLPRATKAIPPGRMAFSFLAIAMVRTTALLLFLVSCTAFHEEDDAAIRAVMAQQEVAWDKGDIQGFMEGYADSVCFIGRSGRTCGRSNVTANYLKSYPDRARMGDLAFLLDEVVPAGPVNAWVTGGWTLHRANDTLGGGFSLLWAKGPEGWRIIRDHTY